MYNAHDGYLSESAGLMIITDVQEICTKITFHKLGSHDDTKVDTNPGIDKLKIIIHCALTWRRLLLNMQVLDWSYINNIIKFIKIK
jgi:hypothetical protein